MTNMPDLDKLLNTVESKEINDIVGSVLQNAQFDLKREIKDKLPYTRKVGVNDIVPEEYQQKLMEIDFTMSQCYWLIGDIANDLVNSVNRQRVRELGKVVSKTDIFEAVGYFCHRTARSVRYYYECAWFFPVEVRQKYDVPFNIYADARWVKDWELLLQIAEENPSWSAEHVRADYYQRVGENPPTREPVPDSGAEVSQDEARELPEYAGQRESRNVREVLLADLSHAVDKLRKVLDRLPLSTDVRVRIGNAILELEDISLEVRREW